MDEIKHNSILMDVMRYAKKSHAELVYLKCLKANKLELAIKIADKYDIHTCVRHTDKEIAFYLALTCNKYLNE